MDTCVRTRFVIGLFMSGDCGGEATRLEKNIETLLTSNPPCLNGLRFRLCFLANCCMFCMTRITNLCIYSKLVYLKSVTIVCT